MHTACRNGRPRSGGAGATINTMALMRVYRLPQAGKIDDLTLTTGDRPTAAHGQAVVRLRATSLNYRDLMIVRNQYSRGGVRPGLVPLSDGAGEVVEVGPGVTRVKVGDRVAGIFHQGWIGGEITDEVAGTALGGDFDAAGLVHVPDGLSFDEAATLPCAAVTAWNALMSGSQPVRPGEVVLTQGTGGVSTFAIQFAAAAGARVISTSSSDAKLNRARALGATETINYAATPDWEKAALELTGGRGVDHVVDVGGAGTLPRSLRCVRRGGTVNVIGLLTGGGGEINPLVLIPRGTVMRGIYVGSREMFQDMSRAIVANAIKPVIDRTFEFEQAADAYRHLESASHVGKVVVRVG
jgi:NADPH:quinone reductase-like Zn-dependent oxidoreductase